MLATLPRQLRLPLPDLRRPRPVPPPLPAGTIRRTNPRLQGDIGMGAALGWFLSQGYRVALPLGESQPWDLIVEDAEGRVLRVQVKTATHRNSRGRFVVQLKTCGGNRSWTGTVRLFDPDAVEMLFILTDAGEQYLFPTSAVAARSQLSLGAATEPFRLDRPFAVV